MAKFGLHPAIVLLGLLLLSSGRLAGQTGGAASDSAPDPDGALNPEPTLSLLSDRPFSTMHMLLEKTIFAVDVLTLDVRVDPTTARRLENVVAGSPHYDAAHEASVARVVLGADELVGRIEFERSVSLDQFVNAIGQGMQKAVAVGWLDRAAYREVRKGLPVWFSFLGERRIREGDRLSYHVHGDTLRTVFATADGEILLDQTDVGRQNVVALVGAWFAPDSSFREELVRSLFDDERP